MWNIHDALLTIIYISIAGLFIESWLVFRRMKTPLQGYLFLSCILMLINNVGYMLELTSSCFESYLVALKFSYLGRTFMTFTLFLFTAQLCRRELPGVLKKGLLLFHVGIYALILTLENHHLYYKSMIYKDDGIFPVVAHTTGIAYQMQMQLQILYLFCALAWLYISLRGENNHQARKRLWMVIMAFIIQGGCFVMQITKPVEITRIVDLSIYANLILTAFMYAAIFRYNLLGIIDVAREYMIDRLAEGVVAVDNRGIVQYYNKPALNIYPELISKPAEVLAEIDYLIEKGETITAGGRIYTPEKKELLDKAESFGMLYALMDTTEQKQKEEKLQADADIMRMAARTMEERLHTAEELMQQDRALRHDRRHFEALLLSLLQDGKMGEVKEYLEERLSQEPRAAVRYCENPTVNAAISHYAAMAEREDIRVQVSANIPYNPGVDEMQLAIAISNLLENAINACKELPEGDRFIEIKASFKQQLLFEVSNACKGVVPLDEEGHPFTSKSGHGIGTRSVLAFAAQTDSLVKYIAGDGVFKVRMIIG